MKIDFLSDDGVLVGRAIVDDVGHWAACELGHEILTTHFPHADDYQVYDMDDEYFSDEQDEPVVPILNFHR